MPLKSSYSLSIQLLSGMDDDGKTPLHHAVVSINIPAITLLLKAGKCMNKNLHKKLFGIEMYG